MDVPSILTDHYRRMTAWICRHVPSAKSGVSHTKVQVLSSPHCVPPRADFHCPSPSQLCETWATRIRSNRRPAGNHPENENCAQDAKPVYSSQDHRASMSNTIIGGGATNLDASQSDHRGHPAKHRSSTFKVDQVAENACGRPRDSGTADEKDLPTCCLWLPLRRWRHRRRAKVAPFSPPSPSIEPAATLTVSGGDTRAPPLTAEVSVFNLEDGDGQESPGLGLPTRQMMKEDSDEWRQRRRSEILLGHEEDDANGISRESLPLPSRPKTSSGQRGENQPPQRSEISSTEVNTWTKELDAGKQPGKPETVESRTSRNSGECDSDEVLYHWTNLDENDNDENGERIRGCDTLVQGDVEVVSRGREATDDDNHCDNSRSMRTSKSDLLPRPKTSRGVRPENGQVGPPSVMEKSATEVIGEEEGVRESPTDDLLVRSRKSSPSLEEAQDSGEVLNIWRNLDEKELKDEERSPDDSPGKDNECDTGDQKIDETTPTGHEEVSPSTCGNQNELITPKSSEHSMDAEVVMMSSEEELRYERKQREQWQLAAIGEWSTLFHDYDDDEYLAECYLRMDEFQKEQTIKREWKSISERYHSVGVIQDLQNMKTLCKCTINQSERALRQFARICRGPVPLSKSGQTKAEAIASLSMLVQKQTRWISDNISNTFVEFYQIFEELDVLRARQDRVEEYLANDLKKRDVKIQLSRSSSRSSAFTPRQPNSRLRQREIDQDLADIYMNKNRVRSTDLFDVMPTINENEVFHLEECQEQDESETDFPEYNGIDDVCLDEDDVTENDTVEETSDSNNVKSAGDKEEEENEDGAQMHDYEEEVVK